MKKICPLSIISGKIVECENQCEYCIPDDIRNIERHFEYLECLNYPNDFFGNGLAENGLNEIASAIRERGDSYGSQEEGLR